MANKSLGTLTIDLVAKTGSWMQGLDKGGREAERFRKTVEKNFKAVASVVKTGAAVGTAAVAALTAVTIKQAGEISRLAAVSGTATDEFQRLAAGAKTVGIEQDKLADIFKDTQDKVGDFIQTGGGALADFFEQIAPQVGVTAEQFRDLSGPEALGLYVSSLEKANVKQSDMVFYLEAIASDSALLLPLLKNNAELFTILGDTAERAGAIMSEDLIRASNEMAAAQWLAEQSVLGLKNQVMEGLMPVLSDLSVKLFNVADAGTAGSVAGDILGDTMKWVAATAYGAYSAFVLAGKGIGGFAAIVATAVEDANPLLGPAGIAYSIYKNYDQIKIAGETVADDLTATLDDMASQINAIFEAGTNPKGADSLIKKIAAAQEAARKAMAGSGNGGFKETEEAKKQAELRDKAIKQLEEMALKISMVGAEEEDLALARFKASLEGVRGAEQLASEYKAMLDILKETEKQYEVNAEARKIAESLQSEEEQIRASYAKRRDIILESTEYTELEKNNLIKRLNQELNDDLLEASDDYWAMWIKAAEESVTNFDELTGNLINNFTSGIGDAFESMVFDAESLGDAFDKLAEGMARSVVNALGEMAAQWLAYQIVQMTVGKATAASASTALIANANAGVAQAGINAYASTAAIPIVGAAAAPAAMAAAIAATEPLAAMVAANALMGMAHDGIDAIPETGTWLLEKGERVTTAETSAKLDATLNSINQNMANGSVGSPEKMEIALDLDSGLLVKRLRSSDDFERAVMSIVQRNNRQ